MLQEPVGLSYRSSALHKGTGNAKFTVFLPFYLLQFQAHGGCGVFGQRAGVENLHGGPSRIAVNSRGISGLGGVLGKATELRNSPTVFLVDIRPPAL